MKSLVTILTAALCLLSSSAFGSFECNETLDAEHSRSWELIKEEGKNHYTMRLETTQLEGCIPVRQTDSIPDLNCHLAPESERETIICSKNRGTLQYLFARKDSSPQYTLTQNEVGVEPILLGANLDCTGEL